MNWAHYLLQVNIYLVVFYSFYKLFLDKETYFGLNRFYLLASALLSLSLPFIRSEWFSEQPLAQQVYAGVNQLNELMVQATVVENQGAFTVGNFLVVVYWLGLGFFSLRFFLRIASLRRLLSENREGAAFSFFGYKSVDKSLPMAEVIHRHEDIHIRQMHSLDVIFFELLCILNWYNPVIYLYQSSIKNIHEFLADELAAQFTGDKKEYALLLLSKVFNDQGHRLSNNFSYQPTLKQRILMLQKERSKRTAIWKYGLFVPLFGLSLILSSATLKNNEDIKEIAAELTKPELSELKTLSSALPAAQEDWPKFYTHVKQSIRYPEEARAAKLMGYSQIKFSVKNGAAEGVSIAGSALGKGCDAEVMKSILSFTGFSDIPDGQYVLKVSFSMQTSETTPPAMKNATQAKVPGATVLKEIVVRGYPVIKADPEKEAAIKKLKSDNSGKIYDFVSLETAPTFPGGMNKFYEYIVETVKYPEEAYKNNIEGKVFLSFIVETDGALSNIKVERKVGFGLDEEAVRIIKQSSNWIPGTQNGLKVRVKYNIPISFTLNKDKKEEKASTNETIAPHGRATMTTEQLEATSPLYIVDGVKQPTEKDGTGNYASPLKTINQEDIASIEVLKDETATSLYGEAGKYGVIIITTTKAAKSTKTEEGGKKE